MARTPINPDVKREYRADLKSIVTDAKYMLPRHKVMAQHHITNAKHAMGNNDWHGMVHHTKEARRLVELGQPFVVEDVA